MIIDTHCHIYNSEIENAEEIIKECKKNNIYMILNGIDPKSNKEVLELASKYDNVYAAIGFHPTELDDFNDEFFNWLEEYVQNRINDANAIFIKNKYLSVLIRSLNNCP